MRIITLQRTQPVGKVYRIGVLSSGSSKAPPPATEGFRQGLRELGWVEGQNIVIDYRFAEYRHDRLSALAAELVRIKVDVIVAPATPATAAAQNATGTIPIVMVGAGNPVGDGFIASFARPGGNGLTYSGGWWPGPASSEALCPSPTRPRRDHQGEPDS